MTDRLIPIVGRTNEREPIEVMRGQIIEGVDNFLDYGNRLYALQLGLADGSVIDLNARRRRQNGEG